MTFEPHVPFPAESMKDCRYCGQKIGMVQTLNGWRPVEPKGFHGIRVTFGVPRSVDPVGFTLKGQRVTVREAEPEEKYTDLVTVFPMHECKKRKRK